MSEELPRGRTPRDRVLGLIEGQKFNENLVEPGQLKTTEIIPSKFNEEIWPEKIEPKELIISKESGELIMPKLMTRAPMIG